MTPIIQRLIEELDALGKTRNDAWQISMEEGQLLHQIAICTSSRVIIEVGTSYGFSGLFWGAALLQTGGVLHTIDADPAKFQSSKQTFATAGLGAVIANHQGKAADVLATLNGPFDLAFIDADKPATRTYFDLIWPKIRVGGSVLTDNATTHRSELSEYVNFVRSLPDASSVEVAVGNGLEWTIKTAKK
jgi:caffeoyl-CoA O-methyltransferase